MSDYAVSPYGLRLQTDLSYVDIIHAPDASAEVVARLNDAELNSLAFCSASVIGNETPGLFRKVADSGVLSADWSRIPDSDDVQNIVTSYVDGSVQALDYPDARYISADNVSALQTVDAGVLTRVVGGARWFVRVSDGINVEQYELHAVHNGSASTDATAIATDGPQTVARIGAAIGGVRLIPSLYGSGETQKIGLSVSAYVPVSVQCRMEWTQYSSTRLTLAELEGA